MIRASRSSPSLSRRIAVIRSFFVGKWRKISASFSCARRAIDAVVVPLNPRAAKSSRAAARIRSRLEIDPLRLAVAISLARVSLVSSYLHSLHYECVGIKRSSGRDGGSDGAGFGGMRPAGRAPHIRAAEGDRDRARAASRFGI